MSGDLAYDRSHASGIFPCSLRRNLSCLLIVPILSNYFYCSKYKMLQVHGPFSRMFQHITHFYCHQSVNGNFLDGVLVDERHDNLLLFIPTDWHLVQDIIRRDDDACCVDTVENREGLHILRC